MICKNCETTIPDNIPFCPKCGLPGDSAQEIPQPTIAEPTVEDLSEALEEPISISGGNVYKKFGKLTKPKDNRRIGLGYVTAGLGILLIALFFLPLFSQYEMLSQGNSAFSALSLFFSQAGGSTQNILESVSSFLSSAGISLESALMLSRVALLLMFILPVLIILFSLIMRGGFRFYMLLVCSVLGGGISAALRILFNRIISIVQGGTTAFLPFTDISIVLYFLVLVFSFIGNFSDRKRSHSLLR